MTNPQKPLPRMFSVADVAKRMSLCTRTIRRAIKSGDLPAHRPGGRNYRIAENDLRVWINRHRA